MQHSPMRVLVPISIAGAIAFGVLGDAVAADTKVHSGSFCVEQADITPAIEYYVDSSARNSGTGYNNWQCPVTRDNTAGGGAGDVTDWRVAVHRGGNTTDAWTLTLYSCNEHGTSCDSDVQTVALTDSGYSLINGAAVTGFENGGMTIESSVPPDCWILHYRIVEE